jgi:hypothetical protein
MTNNNDTIVVDVPEQHFDVVGFIMDLEGGADLSEDEVVRGFQVLIDSGAAWSLQGSYGRMATQLIEAGYCTR